MTEKHYPEPMKPETLVQYRWTTELPEGTAADFATIDTTRRRIDHHLGMVIGETTHPHVFASGGPNGGIKQTIWGYGESPDTITFPGPLIIAMRGKPLTVDFKNILPPATFKLKMSGVFPKGMRDGDYPFVEPLTDMAAGAMGVSGMGRYSAGHAVVHLHGADLPWENDGYPMRLPKGNSNPRGLPTVMKPGQSVSLHYPNEQRGGGLLWYHDHTMDSTSRNVYAGLAGGYALLAPQEGMAISEGELPGGKYHLPLILQDRSFTEDGKLLYGDAKFLRDYVDAFGLPTVVPSREATRNWVTPPDGGEGLVPMSEFKGHALLVNGKIWPRLKVEPRPYRFRILNGCNSRFFVLRLSKKDENFLISPEDYYQRGDASAEGSAGTLYQIGSDGGLFDQCVPLTGNGVPSTENYLVLAPGERADVIIDFSQLNGSSVFLTNHSEEGNHLGITGDNLDRFADTDNLLGNLLRFEVTSRLNPYSRSPRWLDTDTMELVSGGNRSSRQYKLNATLKRITEAEDAVFGLPFGTIKERKPSTIAEPQRLRRYVIKEFGGVAQNPDDAGYFKAWGKWPLGRWGWAAITFQSDINNPTVPGMLWGGSMSGKTEVKADVPQWSPPLMGGPVPDIDNFSYHDVGSYRNPIQFV